MGFAAGGEQGSTSPEKAFSAMPHFLLLLNKLQESSEQWGCSEQPEELPAFGRQSSM